MLRRFSFGLIVLALTSALGASSVAAAEPVFAPGGAILLSGTHGYKLEAMFGAKDGQGGMELFVDSRGKEAIYEAKGEVTPERIDIDLGSLGKFDLERRPTGRTETIHSCGKATKEPGYEFVGTIEFHGEEGFTDVVANQAKLSWLALLQPICGVSVSGEDFGPGTPGIRLKVRRKQGPELQLSQNRPGAAVDYFAQVEEREGRSACSAMSAGSFPPRR